MKPKVVIFSAPSGAGKTTVVKHLLAMPEFNMSFSISACSRKKREGEVDGKDYYFLSADEFRKKIENNDFLEWEEVYADHFYGSLKSEVDRLTAAGKNVCSLCRHRSRFWKSVSATVPPTARKPSAPVSTRPFTNFRFPTSSMSCL